MKPGKYPECDELEAAGYVEFLVKRTCCTSEAIEHILLASAFGPIIPPERRYSVWVPAEVATPFWEETKAAFAKALPPGCRARLSRRRVTT